MNVAPFASSELRASRTTCSFSVACILHVEYTIFLTLGTEYAKQPHMFKLATGFSFLGM